MRASGFKWLWLVGAVPVGAVILALTLAPHLPRLIGEGMPALIWVDRGSFADVEGISPPRSISVAAAAEARFAGSPLAPLFSDSAGKALLVARNGTLEIEHYADGLSMETRFNSFSMVKSLVGALVFKAVADGHIESLDLPLAHVLPEYPALAHITLRSLLMMRSGIHFDGGPGGETGGKEDEAVPNPFGIMARLHFDGLESIATGLIADTRQTSPFRYQNINTALLARVLEAVHGKPLPEILSQEIWKPAGAASALWRRPSEVASVSAYCCLYATARDWIRIGTYLVDNGGPNAPFLPEALWREFLGLDIEPARLADNHYGYHILANVLDRPGRSLQGPFTYMMGQNGQVLYLLPEQRLVVYRAGERIQLLHSTLYEAWDTIASTPH